MHQVFLQRIADHPVLRNDYGFRVFLEYEQELSVRTKNAKEKVGTVVLSFWPYFSPRVGGRLSQIGYKDGGRELVVI